MAEYLTFITWDVDPDMFVIPFLNHPVRWYGLCWAVALLISQQIMYFIYQREGRSAKEVDTMTLYIVLGTLLGARLGHVLFYNPGHYLSNPVEILFVWEGGLASHGATIGIPLAAYFFSRKTKVDYLWVLDRLVIVSALCGIFIRFGNLMNSEIVGTPTDVSWAFVFTRIDDVPRHPAQLYESIYCLFIFIALFYTWHKYRGRFANGTLLGCFLIVLFTLRFVDEFFKVNQEAFEDNMMLNMGQLLSIPFVLCGIFILFYAKRRGKVGAEVGEVSAKTN